MPASSAVSINHPHLTTAPILLPVGSTSPRLACLEKKTLADNFRERLDHLSDSVTDDLRLPASFAVFFAAFAPPCEISSDRDEIVVVQEHVDEALAPA